MIFHLSKFIPQKALDYQSCRNLQDPTKNQEIEMTEKIEHLKTTFKIS